MASPNPHAQQQEELKLLMSQLAVSGRLDTTPPIDEETTRLLKEFSQPPLGLLNSYCMGQSIPAFDYHAFELARRNDPRKYVCACYLDDEPIFGLPCESKKAAKSDCALRILDVLVRKRRIQQCVGRNGRKLRHGQVKLAAPTTATAPVALPPTSIYSFPAYSDAENFNRLNPGSECEREANKELFEEVRGRAFHLFSVGHFAQPTSISPHCRSLLAESNIDAISVLTICTPEGSRPQYFTFALPLSPDPLALTEGQFRKYVGICTFEGGIYYGEMAHTKQVAKIACAAVIVDKLLHEGRLDIDKLLQKQRGKRQAHPFPSAQFGQAPHHLGQAQLGGAPGWSPYPYVSWRTPSYEMEVEDHIGPPGEKRLKAPGAWLGEATPAASTSREPTTPRLPTTPTGLRKAPTPKALAKRRYRFPPEEGLDVRTIFYIVTSHKSERCLLSLYCQTNKLSQPHYTFIDLPDGKVKARIDGVKRGDAVESFEGQPATNREAATNSALRLALDNLVKQGAIAVAEGKFLPPDAHSLETYTNSIFHRFKASTYGAIREAFHGCPLLAYCSANVCACYLVDSVANQASLVSWASGRNADGSATAEFEPMDQLLADCDAVELCRRGQVRFLCAQIKRFAEARPSDGGEAMKMEAGDAPSTADPSNDSIFTRTGGTSKLKLRANLSFHYYWGGGSATPPTDAMATAKRLMRWSALGVQGSLVDLVAHPLFAESFTTDKAPPQPQQEESWAIETAMAQLSEMEGMKAILTCHKPLFAHVDSAPSTDQAAASYQPLSANWNAADDGVELVDPSSGTPVLGSFEELLIVLGEFSGASRLCNSGLTQKFLEAAHLMGTQLPPTASSKDLGRYRRELAKSNTDYQARLHQINAVLAEERQVNMKEES